MPAARALVQPPLVYVARFEIPPAVNPDIGLAVVVVISRRGNVERASPVNRSGLSGMSIEKIPVGRLRSDVHIARAFPVERDIGSAVAVKIELKAFIRRRNVLC